MKKELRKIEKKSISLKNIVEDIKSVYETIFEEKFVKKEDLKRIEINEHEYIQIVKWNKKEIFDFSHVKRGKVLIKGAFEYNEKNEITLDVIYELNFGILTNESDYSSEIYKK